MTEALSEHGGYVQGPDGDKRPLLDPPSPLQRLEAKVDLLLMVLERVVQLMEVEDEAADLLQHYGIGAGDER